MRLDDGSFEADGRLTLDVLKRELGIHLQAGSIETLGGYLMERLGRVARPGDRVEIPGHRVTVVSVKEKRIVRIRGETHDGA